MDRISRAPTLVHDVNVVGRTEQSDHCVMVLQPDIKWDPFVLLVEDWFSTAGFPWHPHRGFQTLTFVLEGELEHSDNAGGHAVLAAGDAQYMAAGRYAMHSEVAHEQKSVHTLQLWINLPQAQKLGATEYSELRAADAIAIEAPGVTGKRYATDTFRIPLTLVDLSIDAGETYTHELPGDHSVVAYVLEGLASLQDELVEADQVAWLAPAAPGPTLLEITASERCRIIVWSGLPVGEPVVARGPFVMSTEQELDDAFADLEAGRFTF